MADPILPTPAAPDDVPVRSDSLSLTIDPLLAASKAAHAAYRDALTRNDVLAARTALQDAYDARTAAQAADPTFSSPLWGAYDGLHPHVALLQFYRQELAK